MKNRKEAKEKYLRTIYKLHDDKIGVKSVEIAKELNISKPSVSEMLRKLASEKLVKIKPYSKIFLTKKGKKTAGKLFDQHYTIKRFFKNIIKHPEDLAENEARKISHLLEEDTVNIIEKMMEGKLDKAEEIMKPLPPYIG